MSYFGIVCGACKQTHNELPKTYILDGYKVLNSVCPNCGHTFTKSVKLDEPDPITSRPKTKANKMNNRNPQYKQTTCAHCGNIIDVARYLDKNFCNDKCRVAYHREEKRRNQVNVALNILGAITGLKHLTDADGNPAHLKMRKLGDKAILKAVREHGYKWSNKHDNFKDSDGNLYGQKTLFDQEEDDQDNTRSNPDYDAIIKEWALSPSGVKALYDIDKGEKPHAAALHGLVIRKLADKETKQLTRQGEKVLKQLKAEDTGTNEDSDGLTWLKGDDTGLTFGDLVNARREQ